MEYIGNMVSTQPGLIPQVTGDLTHARFWTSTLILDNYYNYFYDHLMSGTSDEEKLQDKEAYKLLESTRGARV